MVYVAFLHLNSKQCQKIVQEKEEKKSMGTGMP